MTENKIVALTGATGFIGPYIIAALHEAGFGVRALTRRAMPLQEDVEWVPGDLRDKAALNRLAQGATAFIHGAGAIKARRAADFTAANATGAAVAAKAAGDAGVSRFLLISSLAARHPHLSHYAASKLAGERRVHEVLGERIAWTVLRPPAVYGPGDTETLKIFRLIRYGLAPLPSRDARASWIYASDLARACVHALKATEVVGRTLPVDDGAGGHNLLDVYRAAADVLGRQARPLPLPPVLIGAVGALNEAWAGLSGATPMLTRGKARELAHPDWAVDTPTLNDVTGWRAEVGLAEGLKRTLSWYRAQGWI